MKRSYDEMVAKALPTYPADDPRKFISSLEGTYKLRVVTIADISKPTAKPIEDIDEPENEEENKWKKSSARVLQLVLKDLNNTEIKAVETQRIDVLADLKPNWKVIIQGPVQVRCGNIMLEKSHVQAIEPPSGEDLQPEQTSTHPVETQRPQPKPVNKIEPIVIEDWDSEDEDDCIILD